MGEHFFKGWIDRSMRIMLPLLVVVVAIRVTYELLVFLAPVLAVAVVLAAAYTIYRRRGE